MPTPTMAMIVPATARHEMCSLKMKYPTGSKNIGGRAMRVLAIPTFVFWMANSDKETPTKGPNIAPPNMYNKPDFC